VEDGSVKKWLGPAAWIAAALIAAGSIHRLQIRPADLAELAQVPRYLQRFAEPDFRSSEKLAAAAAETLAMSAWGTGLSLLAALVGLLPASRQGGLPGPLRAGFWGWLGFVRAVPDPILALALSLSLGVGPLSGALALGIHGSGFFTKVLAESVDRLPSGALDGVRSCGAGSVALARWAAWPLISREIAGYSLYMLDRNTRVAATLGLVGAGGLGHELQQALGLREFSRAAAVILIIAGLVLAMDLTSGAIRRRMAA
jgi:phosphonate transport system permease protein